MYHGKVRNITGTGRATKPFLQHWLFELMVAVVLYIALRLSVISSLRIRTPRPTYRNHLSSVLQRGPQRREACSAGRLSGGWCLRLKLEVSACVFPSTAGTRSKTRFVQCGEDTMDGACLPIAHVALRDHLLAHCLHNVLELLDL